jgi:hypothetical protein
MLMTGGETRARGFSHPPGATASQAILDRAYGKAPTFSTTDAGTFKRAIDMTDDELAAIVAKAKLTVVFIEIRASNSLSLTGGDPRHRKRDSDVGVGAIARGRCTRLRLSLGPS